MQRPGSNGDDRIVWQLVAIEEQIDALSAMLQEEPLQRREEIFALLSQITELAVRSRHRVVESELSEMVSEAVPPEAQVTPKEIRELLEAFA